MLTTSTLTTTTAACQAFGSFRHLMLEHFAFWESVFLGIWYLGPWCAQIGLHPVFETRVSV